MPRLTIWHLLMWTAVSGGVAARVSVPFSIPLCLSVVITGGAITATIAVLTTCGRRGLWSKTEPGHWFAFIRSWEYLDMIAVTPVCIAWVPIQDSYIYCVPFLGMAAIYFTGTVAGRWEWYWRLAIVAHGFDATAAVAWRLTNGLGWRGAADVIRTGITPAIGSAAVALVLISIGVDLYRKQYRDWLHWVGAAYFLFHWYGLVRAYVIPFFLDQ